MIVRRQIPSQTDVVVDGIRSVIIRGQLGSGARLPGRRTLPWSSTSLDGNPALQAIARGDPDAARIRVGTHLLGPSRNSRVIIYGWRGRSRSPFLIISRHRCPDERFRSRHPAGPQRSPSWAHEYGVAALGNLLRPVSQQEWEGAMPAAWESGVRYFDVAPHYGLGLAERRLGLGLRGRPRDEFLISTKVGRLLRPVANSTSARDDEGFDVPADFIRVRDYSRDGIRRSLESSLERLGLDRVDIAFVHDPDDFYTEALDHAFPALEELRAEGMITSYGAGMNQSAMLTRFVERTDLDVVMLAGRYTLLEQGALDDLLPACLERNVTIVAAGVFNSGVLATDVPHRTATYNYEPVPDEVFASASRLDAVCNRYGTPLPAVAAQFPLGHPAVRTVCLGAYSAAQVRRNAALFEIDIPEELWSELRAEGLLRADAPTPQQENAHR
jgi:D-threo-aldose 1-dehydrogenase